MQERSLILLAILVMGTAALSSSAQIAVQAGEIIAKAQNNQPIEYDNITIVGYLDLSKLNPPAVPNRISIINSTILNASFDEVTFDKESTFWGTAFRNASFNKTTFLAQADFSNATFGHASFMGAAFNQPVFFDNAEFLENVTFVDSLFKKDASFNKARFFGDANLNYTSFDYYAYFSGAQFLKNAYFSDAAFQGPLDFSVANFTGMANFFESKFGAVSFGDSNFGGQARFGLARFSGLSSFGGTVFTGEANFVLARFSDAAYFSQAHFKNNAIFGLTKFEDITSFQKASFDQDLNFKSAGISTLLLEKASFGQNSRINLNDSDFNRLKAPWDEIKKYVVYDPGVYMAMIDNYRSLGWHNDEDDCYYEYRRLNQAEKDIGWSKALDVIAWVSCGYGVRPGYAVIWALLTILNYALIYWRWNGIRRSAKPLQGSTEIDSVPERATFRNALFFSTMIFLSQGPIDFLPVGRHRYHVIIEGILGWLLLALFLVTLGRIMIR
jgi:uncharacterized protein YjbI with pentapeptide repeats